MLRCVYPWQLFLHATCLSPDEGHTKYLYLGQLAHGEQAVGYLTKGIEILTRSKGAGQVGVACREGAGQVGRACEEGHQEQLSSAYCALAEVYLTDIWWVGSKVRFHGYHFTPLCVLVLSLMLDSVAMSVAAEPLSCRLAVPRATSSWRAVC